MANYYNTLIFANKAKKTLKELKRVYEDDKIKDTEDKMKEILNRPDNADLFRKQVFLGNESLFDKIMQYNTDCGHIPYWIIGRTSIETFITKQIHYLSENPQFTFILGKVLQDNAENDEIVNQPIEIMSKENRMQVQDQCKSMLEYPIDKNDCSKVKNEIKRDQTICQLIRGIYNNSNIYCPHSHAEFNKSMPFPYKFDIEQSKNTQNIKEIEIKLNNYDKCKQQFLDCEITNDQIKPCLDGDLTSSKGGKRKKTKKRKIRRKVTRKKKHTR